MDEAQTMTLRDGRTLGYAEWGDLQGKPVFFFGGSNSSRLMRHPDERILDEMGIHLYTFDRPGMGVSTRQRGRTLLDWAEDIRDFATQKGISDFPVVGVSQGGPYAIACAYALFDLLTGVASVSGVAPLDDPAVYASQNTMLKFFIFLARYAPPLLTLQFNLMKPMLNNPDRLIKILLHNLPPADQERMPEAIPVITADMRESVRQGGAGAADDMRAVVTDWGFRLEDIQTTVFVWQGEADPNVTPVMGRYLAEHIPTCEATFVPGAGHFLFLNCWRDVLKQVLSC